MTGASCRVRPCLARQSGRRPGDRPRRALSPVKTTEEKSTSAERIFRSGTAPSAASSIDRPRPRAGFHVSATRRRRRACLSPGGAFDEGSVRRHPGARRHVRLQVSVDPRPRSSCGRGRDQSPHCVTAVVYPAPNAASSISCDIWPRRARRRLRRRPLRTEALAGAQLNVD